MKKDIMIAGVGGQGILSIAAVIGYAALEAGLNIKQAEVHGMSQRGGDVQSHLRISDKIIYSDLIPFGKADLIIAIEPMESLRYLPMLSETGWLITSVKPFDNIRNYPDIQKILDEIKAVPHHIALDADEIARKMGSTKSANMVVLGATSRFLDIDFEKIQNGVRTLFGKKGDKVINVNLQALQAGREVAEQSVTA